MFSASNVNVHLRQRTFEANSVHLMPILCKRGQFGLKCTESASNVQDQPQMFSASNVQHLRQNLYIWGQISLKCTELASNVLCLKCWTFDADSVHLRPDEAEIVLDIKWGQMRKILFDVKWGQKRQSLFEAKWGRYCLTSNEANTVWLSNEAKGGRHCLASN